MKNTNETLKQSDNKIYELREFEDTFFQDGVSVIVGIDEAGRGPLAGPVVASAVILPKKAIIFGVDDSKKVSEKKREVLYAEIYEVAEDIGIGIVDCKTIDEINILNATFLAMRRAIENMSVKPDLCLVDGNLHIKNLELRQQPIVKGDSKSISISAASIVAKVTRDRLMRQYDELYPEYDFKNNKGYGTKKHTQALLEYGISPIHRASFLSKILCR